MNRCALNGLTTSKARSVDIRRGRSRWTDTFPTGTCTVVLDNRDASFNAFGSADVGDTVNVRYSDGTNTENVFTGRIIGHDVRYDLSGDAVVAVRLVDDLAAAGRWSVPSGFAGTISSQLSGDVMDLIKVAAVAAQTGISMNNDAGSETLAAFTINVGDRVVDWINRIVRTEQGKWYADRGNTLQFVGRNEAPTTTSLTFTDDTLITGIPYNNIEVITATDVVSNTVNITNIGGVTQQGINNTSIAAIGPFEVSFRELLYTSNARALEMAQYLADLKGSPSGRVSTVSVRAHTLSNTDADALAQLDLGDLVRVVFTPPGSTQQDTLVYVESIYHRIGIDTWETIVGFSEPALFPFVLDSDANGILNTDKLGI